LAHDDVEGHALVRIAILGNQDSWYCNELLRAATERDHEATRADFTDFVAAVGGQGSPLATETNDLASFDAVIVRTMPPGSLEQVVFRMDALARLESTGTIVLNGPKAIECAVDKYLTCVRLESAGLHVPETIVCEHADAAMDAFETLGHDVLVKPLFGSEGRGIIRVTDREIALRTFRTLERIQSILYVQRFIQNGGSDLRVLVLNDIVLGAMRRRATDDFRTNVAQNGRAEEYKATEDECELSRRAAKATGTLFAGVDLLYDDNGQCYVIEVNAVPGWRSFRSVTGLDVAASVIEFFEGQVESLAE
jgi:ribosomal protein S6--L-glutamate ligase